MFEGDISEKGTSDRNPAHKAQKIFQKYFQKRYPARNPGAKILPMNWNEVDREIVIHADDSVSYTKPESEIIQERLLIAALTLIVTSALSLWISRA